VNDLPTIRGALEDSFQAIEALCDDLSPADWGAQSLCPEWDSRAVISHFASVEAVLVDWLPEDADTPPSFARARAFTDDTASSSAEQFTAQVKDVFAARRRNLAVLTATDLERPSWTPVGPHPYGRFMEIRVFDCWVHERDITTPLGRPTDDAGPRAEIALGEVAGSLGYIIGKRVGVPDGHSVAIHLTGPLHRDFYVAVDGRARLVDTIERPDVEVTTDSLTFVQLACGRLDPQAVIDAHRIHWTGDDTLGDMVARNLRFTM
jgi:uncharacterized protein (TIGR03083 family)